MAGLTAVFTMLIGLAGDLLALVTEFPLNILVAGMVIGVAFRTIRGAKSLSR